MNAVVLVGGKGTRLRPLTDRRLKPLLPLLNRPMLAYTLDRLAAAGVERTMLAVGADAAPFEAALGSRHDGMALEMVTEPEPLGTSGPLVGIGADRLGDPVIVLNGDLVADLDLSALLEAHLAGGAAATLALAHVEEPSPYGLIERDAKGDLLAFLEKPAPGAFPGGAWVNAGAYVVGTGLLALLPSSGASMFEQDLFPVALERGFRLAGFEFRGYWQDLGTIPRYLGAHADALEGRLGLQGVGRLVPAGVRSGPVEGPSLVHATAEIHPSAMVGPHAVVGEGARIGAGSEVRGSVLHERVDVGAGAVVSGSVAGAGARIAGDASVVDDVLVPP